MAGVDNLRTPTTEIAREIGAKGGYASGESKRRRKLLRECLNELLDKPTLMYDENGNALLTSEVLAIKVIEAAQSGDLKAWEIVRDTAGQKPIEKVMIADVDADVLADVERLVEESDCDS